MAGYIGTAGAEIIRKAEADAKAKRDAQEKYDTQYVANKGSYNLSGMAPSMDALTRARMAQTVSDGTLSAVGRAGSTGSGGSGTAMDEEAQMRLSAQLQKEAEARRFAQSQQLMSKQAAVSHPGLQEQAFRDSSLSRAKDKIGQVARSAMTSLKEMMAGRGMSGSGAESAVGGEVINSGQSDLIDVIAQGEQDAIHRNEDVNDQVYQGNINQRGQNMGLYPSLMGVIASRGLY